MSRKETKKVYHGVPKNITDEHTIFYAENVSSDKTTITATGYGSLLSGITPITKDNISTTALTVDFWIKTVKNSTGSGAWCNIIECFNDDSRELTITHDQYSLFISYPNFNWNNSTRFENNTLNHVRVTIFNNSIILYVNGVVKWKNTNTNYKLNNINKIVVLNGGHPISLSEIYISDLHISNIDRGDYFPSLPQDFIEAKAIIKPRMSQQQIKGDPLYSQTTLDTVKIGVNVNEPQITCSRTSGTWASGDTIKVKGLNGEIISGVIDTDTALCKIIEIDRVNYTITVDTLNGIVDGDSVKVKASTGAISSVDRYIKIIDSTNNIVELHYESSINNKIVFGPEILGGYIIETTASSSSPLVKTSDGTTVVGTWTGLGTNEATFTLGENSSIDGKDLYVEYSLTIPYGNSDFNELPNSIEYLMNESSVKMKESEKLLIEDDFISKSKTYGETCPHSAYFNIISSDLIIPSSSTLTNTNELSESQYYSISECNLIDNIGFGMMMSGIKLQVIAKFNIIKIIENKLGKEIPAIDKVQWAKDNIKNITYFVIAKGNGTQSVNIVPYFFSDSRWYGDPSSYTGTNYSIITYNNSNASPNYYAARSMDTDGYTHLNIFVNSSSSDTTNVILDIAYVKICVELAYDSTFKLYFSENIRSREDKCIPMLVQKETKTIKSFIDIDESVATEYKYNEFKGSSIDSVNFIDVKYSNVYQINSMGTGKYLDSTAIKYKASLAHITKSSTYNYTCEPIKNEIYKLYNSNNTLEYRSGIRYLGRKNTYANLAIANMVEETDVDANNFTTIFPFITEKNGEICFGTLVDFFINRKKTGRSEVYLYPIPNSPLIK